MNIDDYQPLGQEQRLFEFAQFNLPLQGALIKNKTIQGPFGIAEIQNQRKQQIIVLRNQEKFHLFNTVEKAIITKSSKTKQKVKQLLERKEEENEEKESQHLEEKEESDEKFMSSSSDQQKRKQKKVKKGKKKRKDEKKLILNRLTKLTRKKK